MTLKHWRLIKFEREEFSHGQRISTPSIDMDKDKHMAILARSPVDEERNYLLAIYPIHLTE